MPDERVDQHRSHWLDDLRLDLRRATRSLFRQRAFTAVVVFTFALGIGASTAMFSVVKAVLLAPLPYGDAGRIAVIWSAWKGFDKTWLSYDEYEAYETEIPAFQNAAIYSDGAVNLTDGDQPERIRVGRVQQDVFSVLGVSPVLGRGFSKEEDRPNGANVIVIGHALWQRRFNGANDVLGKAIQVNGNAFTIVGVMPEGFRLPTDFDGDGPSLAWLPLATNAEQNGATPGPAFTPGGGSHGFYGVARLKPNATIEGANQQLAAFYRSKVADGSVPATMQFRAFTLSVADQVTGHIRLAIMIVFVAVGFVMLISCANVAGLMLVRGERRRRELAVRVALGAGQFRLTRELLTESTVLAGAGGICGVGLAAVSVWLVRITAPANLPRFTEVRLDPIVLLFAVATSLLAAVLAGVLPALQAGMLAPAGELKEGGRSATSSAARIRWRQSLVATEIALAVVLVCGAGLMVRTVAHLFAVDAGFDPRNVLTMRLSASQAFYPDSVAVARFQEELARRTAELPGVAAVGIVRNLPLSGEMGDWGVTVEGYVPPPNTGTPADWQTVGADYFTAMRLPLKQGRYLDARDVMNAPLSIVVNERFVELYIGERNVIGRSVKIGGAPDSLAYHIVGVVSNVHHNGLTREVKAQFYAPASQFARTTGNITRNFSLVVKTRSDPASLINPVRSLIRSLGDRIPVSDVRTMDDVVKASIAEPRFAMGLLSLFGVVSLVLSAIGIFGIVSQIVFARTHEFGVRAALGASPAQLVLLSVRGGVAQTVSGLVFGTACALFLTHGMRGLLEGVTPNDLPTFATVLVVTGVIAMLATLAPAWRAGNADPMSVLQA